MIVPATSSVLRGAHSAHRVRVAMHDWMIGDVRVHPSSPGCSQKTHHKTVLWTRRADHAAASRSEALI
jgi:hypothetical protein